MALVQAPAEHRPKKGLTILGPGDRMGEGDTELVLNLLPADLAEDAFEKVRDEVKWNTMVHRGGEVPRLVAVQGEVNDDGSFPMYRHPADESPALLPFSPTIAQIRTHVERAVGHPINHVLIQWYRTGADYISEHSDKTVDIVRGSKIVNVSLGAQRVMTLRRKKDPTSSSPNADVEGDSEDDSGATHTPGTPREHQRVPLPHNSMFVLGPSTNARWTHSIRTDKRPPTTKSPSETAFDGQRVSLTFRHIGTFLNKDQTRIWGQGAKGKSKEEAGEVVRGGEEARKLIEAFGEENHRSVFEWEKWYGEGFDVVHFAPPGAGGA